MVGHSAPNRLGEFIAHPRKALWTLTIPLMAGMLFQTVYLVLNMIFVGMVSGEALTAIAFNMPIVFLGLGLVFGLGSGITAVIAQAIGAGDKRAADNAAEHAVALGLFFSVLFTVVGLVWGRPMLRSLGVPETILPMAWDYLRITVTGYLFLVGTVFFRSILAGEGDMKTSMIIQGIGGVLNIALDPLCIFVLDLGVAGAAVATVVTQAVTFVLFAYHLFVKKHSYVTFSPRDFRFSTAILQKIFAVGLPASFAMVIMSLGSGALNRILVHFSSDAVAAFQVGNRVDHFFLMPAISISTSLVTLVGMFYGARRSDLLREVISYGMRVSTILGIAIGACFFVLADPVIALFTDVPDIRVIGSGYLRYIAFTYPFIAIGMTAGRVLQGFGLGMPMLVVTVIRVMGLNVALAWWFAFVLGKPIEWVWVGTIISVVVSSALGAWWLRSGLHRVEAGELSVVGAPAPAST